VATIEQGMRELEHRGSMSAAAACGAVVAEDWERRRGDGQK
jgi:hypothetical protein